jgi:hypothetical protein
MNCEYWNLQIALEVEGDLSPRKSRRVEKHLEICPDCHRFARELSQSQAVLKSLGHEAVDSKVFGTIQQKVLNEIASRRAIANSAWWNWRWTGAITTLLLLGAVAFRHLTQPASNPRGAENNSKTESSGSTTSQVDNRVTLNNRGFARMRMVTRKTKATERHKLGKTLPKPDHSQETVVNTAQTFPGKDWEFVDSRSREEKTSVEVTKVESQEGTAETGFNATDPDPLVIKLVTDDPEIVIVWLVDQKRGLKK